MPVEIVADAVARYPAHFSGLLGISPKYWPETFIKYLDSYGQDKVIFGTDFPVLDFKRTRQEIDALGLRPEAMQKFLRDNARRVYNLKEPLEQPGLPAAQGRVAKIKTVSG